MKTCTVHWGYWMSLSPGNSYHQTTVMFICLFTNNMKKKKRLGSQMSVIEDGFSARWSLSFLSWLPSSRKFYMITEMYIVDLRRFWQFYHFVISHSIRRGSFVLGNENVGDAAFLACLLSNKDLALLNLLCKIWCRSLPVIVVRAAMFLKHNQWTKNQSLKESG